jgi:hypothetical protein
VATATDVEKVPNGALRYTPDLTQQQISDLYQKAGINAATSGRGRKAAQSQSQDQASTAVVWKLNGGKQLEPVQIKLGITDHTTTEVAQVMKGSLNQGDQVITGAGSSTAKAATTKAAPGIGGAPAGGMRGLGR